MTERRLGHHTITLSNEDKVFFPEEGLTKGDLMDYYEKIADTMLPYLRNRPLTLRRYPDGIGDDGFVQQSRSDHFPDWMDGLTVHHGGDTGDVEHILCQNKAALIYLANQGAVGVHRWLSQKDSLDRPDLLIFDLDPPGDDFEPVRTGAFEVKKGMEALGLHPYLMTTGSRGLHVVAPIRADHGFDRVRDLARGLADQLAADHPQSLTTEQRKNKRRGRLYLDIMRNAFGQTAVAPYSVRPRPGAPVATPLRWKELEDTDLGPQSYHIRNIAQRLSSIDDPWKGISRHAIKLETAEKKLDEVAGQ